jgi:uncharacterized repeat protein (TIGR01451 family)/fimbrial isopeptide formation D2 family protein
MKSLFHALLSVVVGLASVATAFVVRADVAYAAPEPSISVVPPNPANLAIGSPAAFTVTFSNTATTAPTTGYGPYVDLYMPRGADGEVAPPNDGLTFVNATYLGLPVTVAYNELCITGTFKHPLTKLTTPCSLGQQIAILQLPFGSYTNQQPAVNIVVNTTISPLADPGYPLTLTAQTGFQFGSSSTGQTPIIGAQADAVVTPFVFDIVKETTALEDETATGPNFQHSYRITTTIASGQVITDLVVRDALPDTIAYVPNSIITLPTSPSAVISNTPVANVATAPNDLRVRFPTAANTAIVGFSYFVPYTSSTGQPVLTPELGSPRLANNDVVASGIWDPIDLRDPPQVITNNVTSLDHTLVERSLAIQKFANPSSASVVYTLDFQVSDFFAFNSLLVTDTLSDGLRLDPSFVPTLQVNGTGFSLPAANIAAANYLTIPNFSPASPPPNDGTESIVFRVSNELVTRGVAGGRLLGGCIPTTGTILPDCATFNDGATTARITYRVLRQGRYSDTPTQGANSVVDARQALSNRAVIAGDVLTTTAAFTPTGQTVTDSSSELVRTPDVALDKEVYAVDGVVCNPQPCSDLRVAGGNQFTFRFLYRAPTDNLNNFSIVDYLPLPIFDATTVTVFTPTVSVDAPPSGSAKFGPAHTLSPSIVPTLTTSAAQNSVAVNFGTIPAPVNISALVIDVLLTVEASDLPYVDGLKFSNFLQSSGQNSTGSTLVKQDLVQMTLTQPSLTITKSVVSADNPNSQIVPPLAYPFANTGACPRFTGIISATGLISNPINSDLQNADGADRVTYAIVVENIGRGASGAFDVRISDTLPSNVQFVPGSLCVTNGAGTALTYTGTLTQGLTLVDTPTSGALTFGRFALDNSLQNTGTNILIATYDVIVNTGSVAPPAAVNSTLINTAGLLNYASADNGPTYLPNGPLTETAAITLTSPAFTKILVGSELSNTFNLPNQAAIGEFITYSIVITVPEGIVPGLTVNDNLDQGLAYARFVTITASPGVTRPAGFTGVVTPVVAPPAPTGEPAGRNAVWNLGTIFNGNSSNVVPEAITITYAAVMLNTGQGAYNNQTGVTRANTAQVSYESPTATIVISPVTTPPVTVVEPILQIVKTRATTGIIDAGNRITYTLAITNPAAGSTIAYDLVLTDIVPISTTFVPGSMGNVSGAAAAFIAVAPRLTATWPAITPGTTSVISYVVTLDANVTPNQLITNTARTVWTSLPGFAQPITRSVYNDFSTERNGSGGLNDYITQGSAAVTTSSPQFGKFLVATEISNTTNTRAQVAIGELVTYTLVISVPEGVSPNMHITDSLPTGLAWVACNAITASAGIATNTPGGFPSQCNGTLAPPVASPGQTITFNLGTVTNSNNNTAVESIRITYTVVVLNVANNITGRTLRNNAALTQQTNVSIGNVRAPNVTVIQPTVGITKLITPTLGDANDPITYTLVLTGASGTTAFDVAVIDPLPRSPSNGQSLIDTPVLTVQDTAGLVNISNFSLSGSAAVGYTLTTVSNFDMPLSTTRHITLTIAGRLSQQIVPDTFITNTFTTTWSSLDGLTSTRRSTFNVNATERPYTATASNRSRTFELDPLKRIMQTSEASTGAGADGYERVTIGEIVTYRLRVRLAEASNPGIRLQLAELLPNSMRYLTGTATVAFIAAGSGVTSTVVSTATPGCGGLNIASGDPLLIPPSMISCPYPPTQITSAAIGATNRITFDLGFVGNTQNDDDAEYVVIQFNAQALNVVTATAGITVDNRFVALIPGFASVQSPGNTVSNTLFIAEPRMGSLKVVAPAGPYDAGDVLTYTLVVTNASGPNVSTAFDVSLTDTFDSRLVLLTPITISAPAYAIVTDVTAAPSISVTLSEIRPGDRVTVTALARVVPTALVGSVVPNVVHAAFTSLPGISGTVPNPTGSVITGTPGTADGERTGSGTGGVNNYVTSSSVGITLTTPLFTKLSPTPTQYAIGEAITYTLLISLPEGVSQNAFVLDDLPTGLGYVSSQVITLASQSGGALVADFDGILNTPTISQTNGDVLFAFGNITTTTNNEGMDNAFVIRISARVLNVPGNVNGTALTNTALLTYSNPTTGATAVNGGSQTVRVIEPSVQIDKAAQTPRTPSGAGDDVTYTLRLTNTGTSPAFDLAITDALPAGITFIATQSFTVSHATITTDTNTAGATSLTFEVSHLDPAATAIIRLSARISDSIAANTMLTNTALGAYSSVQGSVAEERRYTSTLATATLTTGAPVLSLTKQVEPIGLVASNDLLTYTLVVTNSGIVTATGVVLTDAVPTGVTVVSITPLTSSQMSNVVAWSIGDLPVDSTRVFTLVVRVTDTVSGTRIVNTALVSSTERLTATDRTTNTVGLADVIITKSVSPSGPSVPGDSLTWTIRYTNTGDVPAQNVIITDALPVGVNWNGSFAAAPPISSILTGTWLVPTLAAGASGSIVFTTSSALTATFGAAITNTVFITTSTPEVTTTNNSASAASPVLHIDTSKRVVRSPVNLGEMLSYTIRITNTGGHTLTEVPLTDTFDAAVLQYVSAVPTATTATPGQLVWANATGPLAIGQAADVVVTFVAIASTGSTSTTNIVSATAAAGSVSTRMPVTATADLRVTSPQLSIAKRSANTDGNPLRPGERITYTVVISNIGEGAATNVTVSDTLPVFVTFITGSAQISGAVGSVGTPPSIAQGIALPPGAVVTLTYDVQVAPLLTNGLIITNTAAVTSTQSAVPVSSTVTDTIVSSHTLAIDKTAAPTPAIAGGQITYTLVYSVTGDELSHDPVIRDTLPPGTTFVSCAGGCTRINNDVTWVLGNVLTPTFTSVLTLVLDIATDASIGTVLTNTATFTDAQGMTATTTVTTPVLFADVGIRKTVEPTRPVIAGETLTYTLAFSNTGSALARDVVMTDVLPSGLVWNGSYSSTSFASLNVALPMLQWTLGDLSPGAGGQIVFTATVTNDPLFVHYVNTGTIGTRTPQIDIANDTSSVTSKRLAVLMDKSIAQTPVLMGQLVTFTIRLTNTGAVTLDVVPLTDTFDAAFLQFVSATLVPSTSVPGQLAWSNVGSIAPNASVSIDAVYTAITTTRGLSTTNAVTMTAEALGTQLPPATSTATVRIVAPDLRVIKLSESEGGQPVQPGERLTYTIVITNVGDGDATGVVVSDTQSSNNVTRSSVIPANGGVLSFTYAITVANPLTNGTPITNTVLVGSTEIVTPTSATVTDTVVAAHTVAIAKRVMPLLVAPGGLVTYTLNYTVTGNEPVNGLAVSDTLPAQELFERAIPPATSAPSVGSTGTVVWSLGTVLTAGAGVTQTTGTLTLVARDGTPLPNALVITNSATIGDNSGISSTSAASYTVVATHTLAIDKRVVGTPLPGALLTYTIAYTVTGNEPVNDVAIDDVTPPNTTFANASPNASVDPGVGNVGNVRWTLGDFLPAGSGQTLVTGVVALVVRVDAALPPTMTLINNTAIIRDGVGLSATSTATSTVPADVAVEKIASSSEAFAGTPISYTLVVSNNGPGLAQAVIVTDALPANAALVSATPGYIGTDVLAWHLGDVQAGQRISLEVVVQAPTVSNGQVVNTAHVAAQSPETTTDNNTSTVTTTVGLPLLTVSKSSVPPSGFIIRPGDLITYTLVLTNSGVIAATNVVISDPLPLDTTYVLGSATVPPIGEPDPLIWAIPTLAPGQTFSVSFTAQTAYISRTQAITNVAGVASDGILPLPSNIVVNTLQPTAIRLTMFGAIRTGAGVRVRWTTGSERNTFGYTILRGTTPNRASAIAVSVLITARGGENVDTSYMWDDPTAEPGTTYYYWLQETEVNGQTNDYGPVSTAAEPGVRQRETTVYLPVLAR